MLKTAAIREMLREGAVLLNAMVEKSLLPLLIWY